MTSFLRSPRQLGHHIVPRFGPSLSRLGLVCLALLVVRSVHGQSDPGWPNTNWFDTFRSNGFNGGITVIESSGDHLVVGGSFTEFSNMPLRSVARWSGDEWHSLGQGVDGAVNAIATVGDSVYVAGSLVAGLQTDGVALVTKNILLWTGSAWEELGGGTNGAIEALSIRSDTLIVAGRFTEVYDGDGQAISANRVVAWTSSGWHTLSGGVDGPVFASVFHGNLLYVGGIFNQVVNEATGSDASNIAVWDGETWESVAGGVDGQVIDLQSDSSGVFVAGVLNKAFDENGAVVAEGSVFRWSGSVWEAPWGDITRRVIAVQLDGSDMIIGGSPSSSDLGNPALRWDGNQWSEVGESNFNGGIGDMEMFQGKLYVVGNFTSTGSAGVNRFAEWDGLGWRDPVFPEYPSPNGAVQSLSSFSGALLVGGNFGRVHDQSARHVASWNGTSWAPIGIGVSGRGSNTGVVSAVAGVGDKTYAIGGIIDYETGNQTLAEFDGALWRSVGGGVNGSGSVLAPDRDTLYVGGFFSHVNSDSAEPLLSDGVAKWFNGSWMPLGEGVSMINGSSSVQAIAVTDTSVYVGGTFHHVVQADQELIPSVNIARWSRTNWSPMGSLVDQSSRGRVLALASGGPDSLFAGGEFSVAINAVGDSSETANIAVYSNGSWSSVGGGVDGLVYALKYHGGILYVGGDFRMAYNGDDDSVAVSGIAAWNGREWLSLGDGVTGDDGRVTTLEIFDGDLYVGGAFSAAGGYPSAYIARWDIDTANWVESVNDTEPIPELSIYPNPFLSTATVQYILEQSAWIELSLYDALGRRVRVLADQYATAGQHRLVFDSSGLASGLYLFRISSDSNTRTTRAILID